MKDQEMGQVGAPQNLGEKSDRGFDQEQISPDDVEESPTVITRPFDPDRIRVHTQGKTVDLLVRRILRGEIDLAPDFQRHRVWDTVRKSRLIESLLLRIPLPVFYVSADEGDNWSVVDGLQRLSTISGFYQGEFQLRGMEYLTTLDGLAFTDLPRAMQRRIEETELLVHVIQPGTPEAVKYNIFTRINIGGMPLTGQELRHALNPGPARNYLADLASLESFQRATAGSVRDERMGARECVLRFLAFHMTPWREYKTNNLDAFLNGTMSALNKTSHNERERFKVAFERAMNTSFAIFGDDAFRKRYAQSDARKPVSKPLFEAWSVNLAALNEYETERLIASSEHVCESFRKLMRDDKAFEISVSSATGVPQRVEKRFGEIERLIQSVLEETTR